MITDLKINEEKKKEYYEKGYWTHDTIRDVWERPGAGERRQGILSPTTRAAA